MADMNLKIKLDATDVERDVSLICKTAKALLAKNVTNNFTSRVVELVDGGLPDGCIVFLSSATVAGDHIMRFGVSGELKILAAAARTRKFDI